MYMMFIFNRTPGRALIKAIWNCLTRNDAI